MVPTIKLNNGAEMPVIGLGTWLSQKGKAGAAVKHALENGYKHIDCAHVYGNEEEIGENMAEVFQKGVIKREDIFIVSKLWCHDFAKEHVAKACELTLKNLKLDYLDLYLVHFPSRLEFADKIVFPEPKSGKGVLGYSPEMMKETWEQMELLVARGLVKSIGISNFTTKKIKELLEFAKIKPVCNQVELHPYLPQRGLTEFCKSKDIAMVAYSSLGSPKRPTMYVKDSDPVLLNDPVVIDISRKHECTAAQVLLKWGIQQGFVVLPKSVTLSRIEENLRSQKVALTEDDLKRLNGITIRLRYLKQAWAMLPNDTLESFWDNEYLV